MKILNLRDSKMASGDILINFKRYAKGATFDEAIVVEGHAFINPKPAFFYEPYPFPSAIVSSSNSKNVGQKVDLVEAVKLWQGIKAGLLK